MPIIWRDIFKPRYAMVVTMHSQPELVTTEGQLTRVSKVSRPAITHRVYKRSLSMSAKNFAYKTTKIGLPLIGHKCILKRIHNYQHLFTQPVIDLK